jgi:cell division protein FtsI/penicillin-binding protein 2
VTTIGLLLGAAIAACGSGDPRAESRSAAQAFLDAWAAGDHGSAAAATDAPGAAKPVLTRLDDQIGATAVQFALGESSLRGQAANQRFTASWTIPGQDKRWSYGSSLGLAQKNGKWIVHWDPSLVHPQLKAGLSLQADRVLPPRAAVLDSAGQPLFSKTKVVTVGIEPGKAGDIKTVAGSLATALAGNGVQAADIVKDAAAAKPDAFVPVVTLRSADYEKVRSAIHDLPGTVFRDGERLLTPTPTFGQPFLGKVGEASAEILKEAGATYAPGDTLGLSGLQRALNRQLAGVPAVTISLADDAGKPVKQLARFGGKPGQELRTTIDRKVQEAAESALADVKQVAAIVAVKPSTGEIRAVANSTSAPFDVALEGKYPAGSTFKIITATALLQSGSVTAASPVPCPGSIVVGGKKFINHDQFDEGTIPLKKAFALSCNTTFTSLASRLPTDALTRTAAQYGIGSSWRMPVPAFTGSVPAPRDTTEQAADAIGQGTVLVSPFSMAMTAAAVAKGSLPSPTLIAGQPIGGPPEEALNPPTVATLRDLTRAVVTDGTATALKDSGTVAGKTGTAEYGSATPPRSHSWFAGYSGDLAFAVFVYDGSSSSVPATGVTAAFLANLAGQ